RRPASYSFSREPSRYLPPMHPSEPPESRDPGAPKHPAELDAQLDAIRRRCGLTYIPPVHPSPKVSLFHALTVRLGWQAPFPANDNKAPILQALPAIPALWHRYGSPPSDEPSSSSRLRTQVPARYPTIHGLRPGQSEPRSRPLPGGSHSAL